MKYFVVSFFALSSLFTKAQSTPQVEKISGTIVNASNKLPIPYVSIINTNLIKGTSTNIRGNFEIEVMPNDTLHISILGFQSIKVRVTNDWIKNKTLKIELTEKAIALEEVIIRPYYLTGYLEIDSKLIPVKENYRFSISGLSESYEGGSSSPNAFGKMMNSIFNPVDKLYNFFGKKPKELKKLKEIKKDDAVKNALASKFDREMVSALLGVDKIEIAEILQRCSYSDTFIQTANDLQILEAIQGCYEEYKVLKK